MSALAPYLPASEVAARPYRAGGQLERFSTPAGFHDESYSLTNSFTVATGVDARGQVIRNDDDADFIWRSFVGDLTGAGLLAFQFTDPWGRDLSSDTILWDGYIGTISPNRVTPLPEEVLIPASGLITVRLLEYGGGSATLRLTLYGVKRWPEARCRR